MGTFLLHGNKKPKTEILSDFVANLFYFFILYSVHALHIHFMVRIKRFFLLENIAMIRSFCFVFQNILNVRMRGGLPLMKFVFIKKFLKKFTKNK